MKSIKRPKLLSLIAENRRCFIFTALLNSQSNANHQQGYVDSELVVRKTKASDLCMKSLELVLFKLLK